MIRKFLIAAAVLAGGLAAATGGADAAAAARATGDVNLRAGPSTSYPKLLVIPRGARVDVIGCLQSRSWCDVAVFGERGWVSSRYISIFYDRNVYRPQPRVAVPPVTFSFGYWDRWYGDRPFVHDRRWRRDWRDDRRDDWRDDWREERREYRRDRREDWSRYSCEPGTRGCEIPVDRAR